MPARPRLLVVAPYFFPANYGGAVQVYHQLLCHLREFEVTVLAPSQGQDPEAMAVFDASARDMHGYEVLRISRFEHRLEAGVSRARALWDALQFLSSSRAEWRRVVRQTRPDIILCGGTFAAGWLMRSLPPKTAYMNYVHGEELTLRVSGPVRRYLYRQQMMALRRADLNITVSHYSKNKALELSGAPASSFVIHPNFVDLERFTPPPNREELRRRLGWQDRLIMLTIARLSPRKGIDHTLRALAEARLTLPANWLYVIGGTGSQESELRSLSSSLGLDANVVYLGYVKETDLAAYYGASDLFLLPNRVVDGDFEGFGLVFLEANACGTAVIGGREGGSADAIVDGETGLLVDGRSVAAIREAIERLIFAPELRRGLGRRGLERACRDFSVQAARKRFAQTLEIVYGAVRRQGVGSGNWFAWVSSRGQEAPADIARELSPRLFPQAPVDDKARDDKGDHK